MELGEVKRQLQSCQEEMVETLRWFVERESPSTRKDLLDPLSQAIAERFRDAGADVEVLANPDGGNHLRARFEDAPTGERPGLILGHFDTVWPEGTVASRPFRVEQGNAIGPGAYDMKASLVEVEFAFRAIRALGLRPRRPYVVVLTSDEETGSRTSRTLIEEEARHSALALVVEPPLADGGLKTGRKGVGQFKLAIAGRAAHAGVEPEKGVNAIVELAHQVLRLQALSDPTAGTTINVGVVQGGTTSNVVPAAAFADIDVRVASLSEARRIEAAILELQAVVPGAVVRASGAINRPPMERTPQIAQLFDRAKMIGRAVGLELTEGSTGGGSDGNFTAALGVPTLDGLGVRGAGAHAQDERIDIASLPERAALLAALIVEL